MPWAISFIGPHNAGKTSLLREVVRELTSRGLRVGFLKSSKESLADLEKNGTDTRLLRESGALPTVFWGKDEVFISVNAPPKEDFTFWAVIERFFFDCDLVVCEGFKNLLTLSKIEVIPEEPEELLFERVPGVIALVGRLPVPPLPQFSPEDPKGLVDFLLSKKPKRQPISLLVDGHPVGLTRFVSKSLAYTIRGFVQSLRGVKEARRIELKVDLGQDDL